MKSCIKEINKSFSLTKSKPHWSAPLPLNSDSMRLFCHTWFISVPLSSSFPMMLMSTPKTLPSISYHNFCVWSEGLIFEQGFLYISRRCEGALYSGRGLYSEVYGISRDGGMTRISSSLFLFCQLFLSECKRETSRNSFPIFQNIAPNVVHLDDGIVF